MVRCKKHELFNRFFAACFIGVNQVKYTDDDFDRLFADVNALKDIVSKLKTFVDEMPDLKDLERRLDVIPDFDLVKPMVEIHPDIKKIDRARSAIITMYWDTGMRSEFHTRSLKQYYGSYGYHGHLEKMVSVGELERLERGIYKLTDKFITLYIGNSETVGGAHPSVSDLSR